VLNGLIFIPVDIFATYVTIYWLIPAFLIRKNYFTFSAFFLLLAALTIFLNQSVSYFIYFPLFFPEKAGMHGFFEVNYWIMLVSTYTVVAVAAGIKVTKLWFKSQQDRINLMNQNMKSELMLLKSQINPHFLFNTLNNIDSLIHTQPSKASESIVRLSEILRYVTYDNQQDFVPIDKEEEYLRSYIELNALRFGQNYISYTADLQTAGRMIAPMLLIPLVENAIKHGDKKNGLPAVSIHLKVVEHIEFLVVNSIASAENNKDQTGGIGLLNLKRRLELLYPDKYRLEVKTVEKNKFFASLWIH
jgi:LytS/YehU family sensor histidine kinase